MFKGLSALAAGGLLLGLLAGAPAANAATQPGEPGNAPSPAPSPMAGNTESGPPVSYPVRYNGIVSHDREFGRTVSGPFGLTAVGMAMEARGPAK
jgi:hypothetical protein